MAIAEAPTETLRRVSGSNTRQRRHQFVVRCTADEQATIAADATKAGQPVGGYLRGLALGSPGPRAARRPVPQRVELAQLLGLLGRVGGNVNQLAKAFNTDGTPPSLAEWEPVKADVMAMRDVLMEALGRGDQGR